MECDSPVEVVDLRQDGVGLVDVLGVGRRHSGDVRRTAQIQHDIPRPAVRVVHHRELEPKIVGILCSGAPFILQRSFN